MFKWFKRKEIIREGIAQQICDILFPEPIETKQDDFTFLTDYSVDLNLHAALIDLEEGTNDETTRNTIKHALSKLGEARELLMANYELKEKAQYLVVDIPGKTIEERVSSD